MTAVHMGLPLRRACASYVNEVELLAKGCWASVFMLQDVVLKGEPRRVVRCLAAVPLAGSAYCNLGIVLRTFTPY